MLDSQRTTQVMINLISNAVKFSPEGQTVTVRATAAQIDDQTSQITIYVTDQGLGMDEEQ